MEKTEGAARGPEEVSIKEAEGEDEAEIEAEGDAETNVTPEVKGDYEELAYNKEAFQRLTACVEEGNVSWVALMDRANVLLTGHHDKFEFADLVLKVQDHYYLIHVKRAKANSLGHVCTQAERCGMFLSGHLDRSNLDLTFMMAELNSHPKTFAGTRETSSDLFNKSILPDRLDGEYHAFLEAHVFNKNNVFCDALKAFIKTTDFDAKFWFAHHSLFCHVLSRMATLIDEKLTTETFKEFHTIAKNGINKSVFFTEAGVLGAEKRRKITIVVAIIDDGKTPFALIPKEREFKTNSIVRLHQTRQTLSEKRLGFAWTVIPKKADVPIETLREYAYSADDIDTILKLKVLKNPSPTASPSAKKPPRKDASIEINMGTRKEPQTITLIQVPAKNMLIVPSFKKSKSAGTTETYLAKVFNKLVQQKRIMIPYTILMPCEIKGHWVTVEICLKEKSIQIKVIKCRANDKDGLDKKAETFKDNLIERADFESAAMALYNKGAKAKSKPKPKGSKTKDKSKSSPSLETKIDFQIEGPFMHPYTHASGAITVRNILRMITDRAPPDAEEEIGDADATIYQIKREHLQFLVARKQNFSIVFEVDGEADITPRAETRRAPVRQLRQATLEAHIASGTVTTHTRSRDASKGTPAGTPPSNEKGEVQLGELEVSPERRLESGAAKEENDDRISDRIKGEILTKYSELIRVDHSFVTINGKKYIKGIIDGTKGNCCFIALGLTRDVFIEKTCEYITHIEKSLQGCLKDIPIECHQRIIEFLEGAIANVNEKNIQKLKDLDWGAKINTIKSFSEDEKRVLLSGLENLRDKVLALNDGASLDEVRTLLKQLLDLYKDSELLKEKYDVYRYETFKHNFTSFLEGRIEEGEDFHLLKTIFSGGNSATKKSIIQYVFGSDTEKAEKNEWLDPSFIKHLYDVYNIKFVIYENNDGTYQIKCNSDHRSDDDSEIRYLFYSGASHYDLLIPLPEE
ncbi:MAG: hypothetical protein Q8Q56_02485 [Alphaproteobacteria bacterium]|nr:hypothetical protein [Alphaproteobacteria bacterium]